MPTTAKPRFSESKRAEILRSYYSRGPRETVRALGCSSSMVFKLVALYPKPRVRSPLRLSVEEREEISNGRRAGESARSISRRLGRAPSTISRELRRVDGKYRAWRGEQMAAQRAKRPKPGKLDSSPRLRNKVERLLERRWSPQQIAARLRKEYPANSAMQISHETIYKALYVQGRGLLRKELTRHLRTRRTRRRGAPRSELRGRIRDMVLISDRPPEVADRAVPGHWEGDLILGKHNESAIGTLVERHSRYVMLLHLPHGKTAEHVRQAMTKQVRKLPLELRRTLTWDQGREMAQHKQFSIDTGVKVYFCNPHSPWQRGSNENTNGLLRQYFPKGTDLGKYSQAQLNAVARELNDRPRQTLNWMKPCEVLERAVAMSR